MALTTDLECLPIGARFEGGGGLVKRAFCVVTADKHQPYRQSVDLPAGDSHGRMAGDVLGCSVTDHLEGTRDVLGD
ncbi:hypothetical protein D3C75_1303430 [compost metagenome]